MANDGVLKAVKGNRVVRIPENKKDAYIAMGYKITTMSGEVVHEPVGQAELKAKLVAAEAENAELKAKLVAAEAENAELKAKLEEATLYAENADKKIKKLEKEYAELKAASEKAAKASEAANKASTESKATK